MHDIKFRVPYGVNNTGPGKGVLPKLLKDATGETDPHRSRTACGAVLRRHSDSAQSVHGHHGGVAADEFGNGFIDAAGRLGRQYRFEIHRHRFVVVFAGIQQRRAVFTGDGHAVQGDGEVDGGAIEISLKPTLQFIVHKGKKIKQPRVETATDYLTTGLDVDLNVATRIALQEAVDFLQEEKGMSAADAYALSSLAVDSESAKPSISSISSMPRFPRTFSKAILNFGTTGIAGVQGSRVQGRIRIRL